MRTMLPALIMAAVGLCTSGAVADDAPGEKKLVLDNPFFAFDNGTGRGKISPAEQAELLKELGYAGIGYTGGAELPARQEAFDGVDLEIYSLYVAAKIGPDGPSYAPQIEEALSHLSGRKTILWLTVQGRASDGDEQAVRVVREVAELAAKKNVRVALYPHLGFFVQKVEDAIRIAKKVDRENVGASFNLCHWLKENERDKLRLRLERAMPHLFLVSINGADNEGGWDRLIQPLGSGEYDVYGFLLELKRLGYKGPIGLQCYNIKLEPREQLKRSMAAWRGFVARMARSGSSAAAESQESSSRPTPSTKSKP